MGRIAPAGILMLSTLGCLLQDYSAGKEAFEAGRFADALRPLERSLADPNMTRRQRVRAMGMLVQAYEKLGKLAEARRTLDAAAEFLLKDYWIEDLNPEDRKGIHPYLRMAYRWAVARGAVRGLEVFREKSLQEETLRLAALHFERALRLVPPTRFGPLWTAEILMDWRGALKRANRPTEELEARLRQALEAIPADPATSAAVAKLKAHLSE